MNRNDEFLALRRELDQTPPELEYTLTRARARLKKARRRAVLAPLYALCALALCFTALVNLSPGFAAACSGVPLLRQLAAAVDFSPSLSEAVKNDFVQPVEEEQTVNGVTCRVEFLIVDQKQLNIFFTLHSAEYDALGAKCRISAPDGSNYSSVHYGGEFQAGGDSLYHHTVDFVEGALPASMRFQPCAVYGGNAVAEFDFLLEFDPYFTSQGEVIDIGRSFEIDGQTITAVSAELYPTHMILNFAADEGNTAWISDLDLTVEDGSGRVYAGNRSGISATGSPDTPELTSWWLDSPYFAGSESLTLKIAGAEWLDKDAPPVRIDLARCEADWLPEGVRLHSAERTGADGWDVCFIVPDAPDGLNRNAFSSSFTDENGVEHDIMQFYSSISVKAGDGFVDLEGESADGYLLEDCPGSVVWMEPGYTSFTILDEPVEVRIR